MIILQFWQLVEFYFENILYTDFKFKLSVFEQFHLSKHCY